MGDVSAQPPPRPLLQASQNKRPRSPILDACEYAPCLCTTFIYSPSVPYLRRPSSSRLPFRQSEHVALPPSTSLRSIHIPLPSERLRPAPSSSYAHPPSAHRPSSRHGTCYVPALDSSDTRRRQRHIRTFHTAIDPIGGVRRRLHTSPIAIRPHPAQIHKRRGICVMMPQRRASRATMSTYFVDKLSAGLAGDGCALAGRPVSTG